MFIEHFPPIWQVSLTTTTKTAEKTADAKARSVTPLEGIKTRQDEEGRTTNIERKGEMGTHRIEPAVGSCQEQAPVAGHA